MKKIIIILLSVFICLCIVISMYLINKSGKQADNFEKYLRNTKANTSKIEITYNSFSPDPKTYELSGKDAKDFFDCLRLKVPLNGVHCKCIGNPVITIYSKDKAIDRFTIHHDNNIRCDKFNIGNITILPESIRMLKSFFAKHKIDEVK